MEEIRSQDKVYQPATFWEQASKEINSEFNKYGLKNFRRLPSSLRFFVPTYGIPGNGLKAEEINKFLNFLSENRITGKQMLQFKSYLSGEQAAIADYRTFLAACSNKGAKKLLGFSESTVWNPIEQFIFQDKAYSRASLNYLLGLTLLSKYTDLSKIKKVLEVGGGFGSLGEISIKSLNVSQYINVDIYPTLYASKYYLSETFGTKYITQDQLITKEKIPIKSLGKITLLPTWKVEILEGRIDLFVNFISFQEMEPFIVKNYIKNLMKLKPTWILLRNLREGKQKTDGKKLGVKKPIVSEDYLNMLFNYDLITTNVFPFGLKTLDGFHSEIMLFRLRKST